MPKHSYNLTVEEVQEKFGVDSKGLNEKQVKVNREEFGYNELPQEKPFSLWIIFFNQFRSTLIYILLIAAAISFILDDIVNMWVILAADRKSVV